VSQCEYIVERRVAPLGGVELHQEGDGLLSFRGHAAVFDQLVDLGPWREQIAPGAFKKTIKDGTDVRFLYNHEPDSVMARTKNGTLRLTEDKVGLVADADLDPTDWDVQRLAPKLRRGDVDQMSFAFRVVGKAGEEWNDEPEDGGKAIRTLRELQLFDTSPVTFPAYEGTDGGLRQSILAVAERRGIVVSWDDEPEDETKPDADPVVFTSQHLTKEDRQVLRDLMTETRACGAARDLPLADKGGGWDGAGARARMQALAGGDDFSPAKYRRGFLYYDADAPELLGSYKLPFADVKGGTLTAIPEGVYAAAQRLGGTAIGDADKATAKSVLSGYYSKLDEEPPWDRAADDGQEDRTPTDTKDAGASSLATEDATAPPGDSAPAADEPEPEPATPAPRTYDAETLWERIAHIKQTL